MRMYEKIGGKMFGRFLVLLICSSAFVGLAADAGLSFSFAKRNPAYVKWLNKQGGQQNPMRANALRASGVASCGLKSDEEPKTGGLIPTKIDFSYLTNSTKRLVLRGNNDIPVSYDKRGQYSTPVRHQDPNNQGLGTCWAQATVGSMETWLKKQGVTVQYSVRNIVNNCGMYVPQSVDDWEESAWNGGNFTTSSAYLLRWNGPISESADPYVNAQTGIVRLGYDSPTLPPEAHLQRMCLVPARTSSTDNDGLKRAIMEFGGVYVSMSAQGYSEETDKWGHYTWNPDSYGAYYLPNGDLNPNHAVTVVGWDDTYSKENFNKNFANTGFSGPAGNGAFIVKDSYGNDKCRDNGYIYVSYYDAVFARKQPACAFPIEPTNDNYSRIYQYDTYGWIDSISLNDSAGRVYSKGYAAAMFEAEEDSHLAAIGFYATQPEAQYKIAIYSGCKAGEPSSGDCLVEQEGVADKYAGFQTIKLDETVTLTQGKRFSVVLYLSTPNADPFAVEYYDAKMSPKAIASRGETFFSLDGKDWADAAELENTMSFCCKAYATDKVAPPVIPNAPSLSISGTTLSWNPVSGAKYYKVYRATNPYAEPTELSSWLTSTSLLVQRPASENSVYFYYVKAASSQNDAAASAFSSERVFLAYPTWFTSGSDYTEMYYYTASSSGTKQSIHSDKGMFGAAITFTPLSNASSAFTAYVDDKAVTSSGLKVGSTTSFGSAAKTLTLTHSANTSTSPRTYGFTTSIQAQSLTGETYVHWSGRPHYFYQAGVNSVSLGAETQSIGKEGGAYTVNVGATPTTVAWTATVSDNAKDWITLYRTGSTGSGVLGYIVAENTSGTRQGTITVGGKTLTITQAGPVAVTHTVTFVLGTHGTRIGGGILEQTVADGAAATAPTVQANEGYVFDGWDKAFSSVTKDLTVTAKYSLKKYSIAYTGLKGASNPSSNPSEYTIETPTITFVALSDVDGFKFTGWNPASIVKGSTGDKTVTAQWQEIQVELPNLLFFRFTSVNMAAAAYLTKDLAGSTTDSAFEQGETIYHVYGVCNKGIGTVSQKVSTVMRLYDKDGKLIVESSPSMSSDASFKPNAGYWSGFGKTWQALQSLAPGKYRVTFVTDPDDEVDESNEGDNQVAVDFTVTPKVYRAYYVKANGGNDGNDGSSSGTAFASIQKAIDSASDGDTIWVDDGDYTPIATGNKRIVIRSVNGAGMTSIDAKGESRCALLGSKYGETNTVLSGFTLINGVDYNGGGVFGGTLQDCVLAGNESLSNGNDAGDGMGGGACCSVLERCYLVWNVALYGAGAHTCVLNNCLVGENEASAHGGAAYESTLNNCTIVGNSANYAGGCCFGELKNCIVWGNSADNASNAVWGATCRYSCIDDRYVGGAGVIHDNPIFMRNAGIAEGDYSLQPNSPCVNSGCDAYAVGDTDLDDEARVYGGHVDMGALEWQGDYPDINLVFAKDENKGWTSPVFVTKTKGAVAATSEFIEGDAIYLYYGVRNCASLTDVRDFKIQFTLNSSVAFEDDWRGYYISGGKFGWSGDWCPEQLQSLAPGSYTLKCKLIAAEGMVETDTSDNELTINFVVKSVQPEVCEITYENLCGATHDNPSTYEVGSTIVFSPPAGRAGYTFTGWTPESITPNTTGAQTVTAGWRPNTYTIGFDSNGGIGSMEPQTFTYDVGQMLCPNAFTREGYDFLGWAWTPTNEVPQFVDGEVVKNLVEIDGCELTFFAVWSELPSDFTIVDGVLTKYNGAGGSVTIPEGVTRIGGSAFADCIGLLEVTIPSSVSSIGAWAFKGCAGLRALTLQEGVTSIKDYAFYECSSIESVVIPSSVTSVGGMAFWKCSGLESLTICNGVESIGDFAFGYCSGLESVTIPSSVTSIGKDPFGSCDKLKTIDVSGESCAYSSEDGILYTKDQSRLIQCPAGKIGEVRVPNGVESIEYSAFSSCKELTSVEIPSGVTNIADRAFSYCYGLTAVSIPASMTSIGEEAFLWCGNLETVYVDAGDESRVRDLLTGSGLDCSGISFVQLLRIVEIDKPTEVGGLVYTGTKQSGIGVYDPRLERSGNVEGNDAGRYAATFTLPADTDEETFVWSDGSSSAVEVEWEIMPRNVSDGLVTFAAIPEQTYAGSAITPIITMTFGGVVRSLGTDYTVTYSDNAAVGTGHATVTGIGNFTGQKVLDFEIVSHSVEHPMPDDWVKPQRKQNWQLITARVYDKTTESYLEHDEARMAAFDANGNCYGVDQIEDIDGEGDYLFMLNVGFDGNSAAGLTLKYWDPVLGVLDIAADITVYANEDIGDIINPVIYEIGDVEVTATIGQGYTWVSFPVVPEDASFDSVFAGCAFNAGDKIQTDGYSVQYSTKGTWVPASYKVVPGAMYVVKKTTAGDASITVTGSEMEKELAVGNGYNWLGCLSVNEIPLANLVHSAGFADGDKIQAQGASAQYVSKTGAWTKQISALVPGLGYKVKLANAGRLSVTSDRSFNSIVTANAVSKEVLSGVKSNVASPNWTKPSRCLNWQVITARVYDKTSGKYLENPDALLAAFDSDGVCYGVDKIEDVGDGEYMFMLNVGFNSNNVSGLTLKYWDPEIEEVVVATGVGLEANEDIGNVVSPVIYERAAAEPIPPLPLNPTVDDVKNALEGSADAHLQECITEPAEYNAYRQWAETVKAPGGSTAAGAQAVKDSPNAWLSYALDAETLIQTPPADGDVKVEKFEQTATAGAFDFTVGVENIPVGEDAKPGNLAKVFGIEGGSTLSPQDMSSDKVDITFGTPENGKVKFTAGPKDKTQPTFFMKVKVK